MYNVIAPFLNSRTYKHVLAGILQLPIGIAYFTVLLTGLASVAGLVMSVIGIPFAVVLGASTLYVARQLWNGERWVLERFYDVDIVGFPSLGGDGFIDAMKELYGDAGSWIGLLAGMIRLPLGILAFALLVATQATFLALLAAPLAYNQGFIQVGGETLVNTPFASAWAVLIGVVGIIASAHIIRFVGDHVLAFITEKR